MLDNEDYAHGRRRSVDVGGLALALKNQGLGHGWGSWDHVQHGETRYTHFAIFYTALLITTSATLNCSMKCTLRRRRPLPTAIPMRAFASNTSLSHP